jgi:hypothetical protein
MSEYSRDPISNNQVLDAKDEMSADPELLKWAGRIFVDPLSFAHRIPAELFTAERITPEYETPLYLDWQVRDTELGYRFLNEQRERLLSAVESFGAAIEKKQKSIVSARARLRALQKIVGSDPTKPGSQQATTHIDSEISDARAALAEILSYSAQIETLSVMLNRAAIELGDESYHLTEQRMRLLGQSWRGWVRVRAYQNNFAPRNYSIAAVGSGPAPLLEGLVITHSTDAPSPLGTDLLICPEVAAYLRHYLTAIAGLSAEMAPYFQPRNRPRLDPSSWPNPMLLLRAIVEFFYFCSFELPVLSNSLMVDPHDPNSRLLYSPEKDEWQPAPEEALSNRLKRDSATVAHLILSVTSLLDWQTADDVSVPVCETAQKTGAKGLRPYRSTGLARLNINQSTQVYKFQPAYKLTGRLIEQLIAADPYLSGIFQSPLGGGLETITGMAALDFRAFKSPGTAEQMPSGERFQWLSHFWKTMGKWRPIALLGDNYTKEISAGLNSLGEAAPERSSMVSIQLPTLTRASFSRADETVQQDPLTTLTLADQIRLLELLNITWAFADEIVMRVSKVENRETLQALIASLPEATSRQEADITRRFNTKWVGVDHPFWNLLRGCAPAVWEFWTTLSNQSSWVCSLSQFALEVAVNRLLNLCADVIRLILLLESSSPAAAERLNVDSETAGRVGLTAFQRCHKRIKESKESGSSITESLCYYYDSEVLYDAWIAFTSSFKTYLRELQGDLQRQGGSKPESAMFARAIAQLELYYPAPIKIRKVDRRTRSAHSRGTGASTSVESEMESAVRSVTIDEKDAERLELLSSRLIERETIDQPLLLKLLALLQLPEMRDSIQSFAEFETNLRDSFPDPAIRRAFFSTPAATRDTAQFLVKLQAQNNALILSGEPQKQLEGYLTKLGMFQKYVESALGRSSFSYPEERAELCALPAGTRTEIVLFSLFDHFFCILARKGTNDAVTRIEEFLKQKSTDHFSNWKPEYLLLGAVGLRRDESGFEVTGSDLALDPIFLEPEKRASGLLISNYLQGKYGMAVSILRQELSDQKIVVQPR